MTLYKKFGLTIPLSSYLEGMRNANKGHLKQRFRSVVGARYLLTTVYYLLGDITHAKEHGRLLLQETQEYFFWKPKSQRQAEADPSAEEKWMNDLFDWGDHFSSALCWASCLDDWEAVRQLARFPTESRKFPPLGAKQDRAFYICLAAFLRGERVDDQVAAVTCISEGKQKRSKLLLHCVKTLEVGDAAASGEALNDYLKHFKKGEFSTRNMRKLLSEMGTFLVNIAARENIPVSIPSHLEDHIIRLD